ncbi:hypothetical protein [Saccharibacillus alkalitolerans]|uniref:DUF3887 domain-containing protein n=1 Tax=Saccharibacillus alkalitolerans TaxID=2705290 RepID=A0ABX0F2A6_9BACL|nr:hypothetical protein [Saccharibacillus alkalitolerans]NGZ74600.1 hypothetical protein [Saccharibacillus alkalitolerans]
MKTSKLILSLTLAAAAVTGSSWAPASVDAAAASSPVAAPKAAESGNPYEAAGIDDPKAFHAFFAKLQKAVKNNDKKAVASMMHYPLNVNYKGKTLRFQSSARFIAKYDSIMTPQVRKTLGYAVEDDLFVNWRGVSVGSGTLWIGLFGGKLGVYAVNK